VRVNRARLSSFRERREERREKREEKEKAAKPPGAPEEFCLFVFLGALCGLAAFS